MRDKDSSWVEQVIDFNNVGYAGMPGGSESGRSPSSPGDGPDLPENLGRDGPDLPGGEHARTPDRDGRVRGRSFS